MWLSKPCDMAGDREVRRTTPPRSLAGRSGALAGPTVAKCTSIRSGGDRIPTLILKWLLRYCNIYAPSTIYSTGNFLFVRIRTDSFAASNGFTAVYELASCGGTVVLRPGSNYSLTSPNYPDVYPLRSECDWSVRAPNSHMVEARVVHVGLTWNVNCSTDSIAIRDGNKTAPYLMEPQCNGRQLAKVNYRSASSEMTVQFRSNACGGIITDQQGQLTTPGFPGRLLPHVRCQWVLRAGIGYRYMLSFEFTEDRDAEAGSPPAVRKASASFFNGEPKHEAVNYRSDRMFCDNRKTFVSDADLATIIYTDSNTKHYKGLAEESSDDVYYVPFRVNYTKVPNTFDKRGCGLLISGNTTQTFGNYSSFGSDTVREY
ncbi:CUB domain protein [Ostertagia ostertagi]